MSLNGLQFDKTNSWQNSNTRILLCGKSFIADTAGALYWPAEQTLIVSDPHLKSDEQVSYPSISIYTHETRATLIRIQDLAQHYDAKRIIILGGAAKGFKQDQKLDDENLQRITDLQKYYCCYWVMSEKAPDFFGELGSTVADHFILSGITFRHKPTRAPIANEIAGFMNPVARQKNGGKMMGQRCFISSNARLIMPTLADCGAGNNILGREFDPMFAAGKLYVWILGTNDVHPVAARLLEED